MTSNNLTRERIEKVKKNVCISLDSLADENGEVAKSHKDDLNTILTLANAEFERQSVTDEDVAEAIQYCVEQEQFNLETLKVETLEPKSFFEWRAKMYRTAAKALQAYRPERGEHPVGDIRYFAVTTEDGEILGYFDLVSNEAVGKTGILTRIGYGEPTFIDRDGVVYLGGSEESE